MICIVFVGGRAVLASAVAGAVAVTGSNNKTCLDNFNFVEEKK